MLLGLVALGTLAAALLHGPALAGLGVVAAFATPILVSSDKPDFWSLYVYLAIVTAAAFALARIRLWRWLRSPPSCWRWRGPCLCLECEAPMVGAHVFHVIAGFVLAALLVVCGFLFGPPAEQGRIEPISSGALAAYLLGATAIVITSLHADAAMTAFALLVAGTLLIAWRAPAATGAVVAAAVLAALVFLEWAVLANPDMLVLAGGALPGIGPHPTDGSVSLHLTSAAIFAAGFGVAGFLAQGRLDQRDHSGGLVRCCGIYAAGAVDRALRTHRASRSLDPVRDPRRAARGRLWCRDRILGKRDNRPGLQISIALFATGSSERAGAGADLRTRQGPAVDRDRADVARHRMDLDATADPVPAFAGRHSRRDRGDAYGLRAAHCRRRHRHHADLQLAAMGLWRTGAGVLGRQPLPAPPRR